MVFFSVPGSFDSAAARTLQSELVFYGQSLRRLEVLPESELTRDRFEALGEDEDREESD